MKQELKFEQYSNDSCLFKLKIKEGTVFLIIYVDDCLLVGDKEAVQLALTKIENYFDITRSEEIEDFIGCNIERKENKSAYGNRRQRANSQSSSG